MREEKSVIFFLAYELQLGTDECDEDPFTLGEGKDND